MTPGRAQRRDHLGGRVAVDREGDDRAELLAEVVDRDAGELGEPRAQLAGQRAHAVADRLEPDLERVVGRHAEPDLGRDVRLPVLEAAGVGADDVGAVGLPLGGVQVEQRRLECLDQPAADVEEAGAARAAQELAPGGGEHVAADLVDVDRELPDRLAGVEQVAARRPRGRRRRPRRRDAPARPGSARG